MSEPMDANQRETGRNESAAHGPVVHCIDRLRWPLAFLFSITILALTAYLILRQGQTAISTQLNQTAAFAEKLIEKTGAAAEKFQQGHITQTFVASLPNIKSSEAGRLELATLDSVESFRSEDNLRIIGNKLSLGTTIAEISVPVTYRYHLNLSDSWQLSVSNQTCLVTAPRIRPTIPPSIHTGRMEKSTQNGWGRFNADEQLETLEQSLTATLVQYADDEDRVGLIRERARTTVANFVKNWLLREDQWREDRFHAVIVRFDDEPEEEPLLETAAIFATDLSEAQSE